MNVVYFDLQNDKVNLKLEFFNKQSLNFNLEKSSFDDVLSKSDFITLHVPSQKEYVIGTNEFNLMKDGVGLINAARGGIVNEEDLNNALDNNIIAFAGIDVFEKEPPESTNPLITNKKVVLSPHSATFTKEGLENMAVETAQNIIDFFENKIENTKIVKL